MTVPSLPYKDFFAPEAHKALSERILLLSADAKPHWGKMNASQMLRHCQHPINVALGRMHLKKSLAGFLLGRIAKKTLVNDAPFRKNLPTAPSYIVKSTPDFETERQKLLRLLDDLYKGGPDILTNKPHGFFGQMTKEEWIKSLWKHLDHHLRQFGV